MTSTLNKRIGTIDMLRGLAIFGMILCGNIGFGSGLPGWMFHCQTPPPTYAFNPTNVGITWVDLVFPFFLFTMGAAFPLAMRKKLDSGVSRWSISGNLFRRWLTLAIFALVLGNGYKTGSSARPEYQEYLFNIVLWGVMFMSLVRVDGKAWGKFLNNTGLFLLVVMAFIRVDYFEVPLSRWSSNIIIMIMAYIALFGGLIWMFTKNNLKLRWLVLFAIGGIKFLSAHVPQALEWAPQFTSAAWIFRWKFLQYLFVAVAGSIVGDLLLSHSKSGKTLELKGKDVAAGFIAITAVVLQLWGLYTRNVLADFIISALLALSFISLTIKEYNIMGKIGTIGFLLMLIGIALDPVDGGITKDHCNLSYLFTTSGMAALTVAFFLLLEFKWNIQDAGLTGCGQNPMMAYTVTSFLTTPLLSLVGIAQWLNTICIGSPFWGIMRGLIYTLLMVLITTFFTKKKLFWRS